MLADLYQLLYDWDLRIGPVALVRSAREIRTGLFSLNIHGEYQGHDVVEKNDVVQFAFALLYLKHQIQIFNVNNDF